MNKVNDLFLDLIDPKLDDAQSKALKVTGNAVIAAGAGSGKTQVLATRFAWLIMTGQAKVDEILTLTFTNKAASEMYQRIYQTLSFFVNQEVSDKLSYENKKYAQEALDNFASAHIQTLDSYCGGVVRQTANRYGIKPDFTTGSSESSSSIKTKAFSFVLRNTSRIGIQNFTDAGKLQEFSEDILANTIEKYTSLASEENFFTNKIPLQRKEIIEAYNYYFLGKESENFSLNDKLSSLKKFLFNVLDTLNNSKNKNDAKKKTYIDAVINLNDLYYNISDSWPRLTDNDLINNNKVLQEQLKVIKEFLNNIEIISSMTGGIKDVKSLFSSFKKNELPILYSIFEYINQYESICDLYAILDDFLIEVNKSKRTSGNLTFNDVTELALKILLENPDIRNQEKNAYKKIMIDEFQDNNGKNRDLLYLLSLKEGEFEDEENKIIKVSNDKSLTSQIVVKDKDGNIIDDKRTPSKLFFVGDEKQSIYMFRGAEVSVFNELTKNNENALISMTYNYRSKAPLVESFNRMFKGGNGIFDQPSNKKDYEAYYENDALKNGETLLPLTEETVPVHVKLVNTQTTKTMREDEGIDLIPDKDQVAYYMAKQIYEIGKEKGNWKDIAILDKSRGHRDVITKYLSMFNIPYEVDQFNNLFEDGIVNDFYNFLRLCVYPSDKKAYCVYLTCPLSGLSITSLETILAILNKNANDKKISFDPFPEDIEVSNNIKKELKDNKDYEKWERAKAFFYEYKEKTLQQQLTSTISSLWHIKGYKYETLLSQSSMLCQEHFDMLFEMARNADTDGKNVSWFVDQLALLSDKYNREDAELDAKGVTYPLEREEAVKIMTIHKSKGLQFSHVFIYGCFAVKPECDKAKTFYDEEFGVSIKPNSSVNNYFVLRGAELARAKEVAEFRRLIYVAITRAKEDVYIVGIWNQDGASDSPFRLLENTTKMYYPTPCEKTDFNPESGFDFQDIKPLEYKDLPTQKRKTSIDTLRKNLIENCDEVMENANIINYEVHDIPRLSPSKLESITDTSIVSDIDKGDIYDKADDLLLKGDFEATDFGTLAHAYLEAQCNGLNIETFEPKASLFKSLSDDDVQKAKDKCIEYAYRFKNSELGKKLDKAKENDWFYKAEWGFSMWYEDSIFKGFMDLIFSNGDGTYTIVDYKSNNEIEPERYIAQQHSYRTAASKLLNVDESKISLFLYYLKHDKIEEIK